MLYLGTLETKVHETGSYSLPVEVNIETPLISPDGRVRDPNPLYLSVETNPNVSPGALALTSAQVLRQGIGSIYYTLEQYWELSMGRGGHFKGRYIDRAPSGVMDPRAMVFNALVLPYEIPHTGLILTEPFRFSKGTALSGRMHGSKVTLEIQGRLTSGYTFRSQLTAHRQQ
jgi:hypothetical protein